MIFVAVAFHTHLISTGHASDIFPQIIEQIAGLSRIVRPLANR
ncbi:MAG: hypothetical protein PCFJNLEI_01895 [Verrucomicrobiae bacterium]|nr:hypothetical protein [Verrucomicrobiae bacterium]